MTCLQFLVAATFVTMVLQVNAQTYQACDDIDGGGAAGVADDFVCPIDTTLVTEYPQNSNTAFGSYAICGTLGNSATAACTVAQCCIPKACAVFPDTTPACTTNCAKNGLTESNQDGANVPDTADNSEVYTSGTAANIKYYAGFDWSPCIGSGKTSGTSCQPTCKSSTTVTTAGGNSFDMACDTAGYIGYRSTDAAAAASWDAKTGTADYSMNDGNTMTAALHHTTFGFWVNFGDYPYTLVADGGINTVETANALQCSLSTCVATSPSASVHSNDKVTSAGPGVDYSTCEAAGVTTGDICTPTCQAGYTASWSSGSSTDPIDLLCSSSDGSFNGATNLVCTPNPCIAAAVTSGVADALYTTCGGSGVTTGSTCTPTCATGYTANAAAAGFKLECAVTTGAFANTETSLTACTVNKCETVLANTVVAGIDYDEGEYMAAGTYFDSGRVFAPHCSQEKGYTTNIQPDVVVTVSTPGTQYHINDIIRIPAATFATNDHYGVPDVLLKVATLASITAYHDLVAYGPIGTVTVITPAHPYRGIAVGGTDTAESFTLGTTPAPKVIAGAADAVDTDLAYHPRTTATGAVTAQDNDAVFSLELRRVIIVTGGTGWAVGDTFTIPDSLLGSGGAPDMIVTVATVAANVITHVYLDDQNAKDVIEKEGAALRKPGYYTNLTPSAKTDAGGSATYPTVSIIVPQTLEMACTSAAAVPTAANTFDFNGAINAAMTCSANSCDKYPKMGGADQFDWSDCTTKSSGQTCTPVCSGGYATTYSGSPLTLECPNGWIDISNWVGPTTCAIGTCSTSAMTGAISGVDYADCNGKNTGDTCQPTCPTGSTITTQGSPLTLSCNQYGVFSGTQTTPTVCNTGRCTAPPTNPNTGVDYSSCTSQYSGYMCNPTCESGYTTLSAGSSFALQCASDGSWGSTSELTGSLTCSAASCSAGVTSASAQANVDYSGCSSLSSGGTCTYACNTANSGATASGSFTLECTNAGYTDPGTTAPCPGYDCSGGVTGGATGADYSSCDGLKSGNLCSPTCLAGYNLAASTAAFTLACVSPGLTYANPNANFPVCQQHTCTGTVTGNSLLDYTSCANSISGYTCTPTCPPGYTCSSTPTSFTLSCSSSGAFTDSVNTAITRTAKRCKLVNPASAIANVEYGHCTTSTSYSGSTCTPTCVSGYSTFVAATSFTQVCDTAGDNTGLFDGTNTIDCRVLAGQTCGALGWTNIVNGVCGETDSKLGPGQTEVLYMSKTYDQAVEICEDAGVRLCTQSEIDQGSAKDTGSASNQLTLGNSYVWTSTSCNGGLSHVVSQNQATGAYTCQANHQRYPVQCCTSQYATSPAPPTYLTPPPTPGPPTPAPTPVPPTLQTSKTCSALGWTNIVNGVCGESDKGFNSGANACYSAGKDSAQSICTAVGARLCTTAEVNSGVTVGTGCNFDPLYTWTSDSCTLRARTAQRATGFVAAKGDGSGLTECLPASTSRPVRCCADEVLAPTQKTCSELGWTSIVNNVCGESEAGTTPTCQTAKLSDATDLCAASGARMCTIDEIDSGVTATTGCNFDTQYTWTSTWCGLGPEGGKFYIGMGAGGSNADRKCKNPKKLYPVRCCSDVDLSAVTAAPATTTTTFPFLSARKDCATLGWEVTGSACGESDKAFKNGVDKCFSWKNHPDAERKCKKLGGRMCSQADIEAGVGKATGCGFDSSFLWTSTQCSGGYIQAKGNGDGTTQCREAKSKGPMRCCSDVTVSSSRENEWQGKSASYTADAELETQTRADGLSRSAAFATGSSVALLVGLAALAVSYHRRSSAAALGTSTVTEAAEPNEELAQLISTPVLEK